MVVIMCDEIWSDLHKSYKQQDWIDKPSIFADQRSLLTC